MVSLIMILLRNILEVRSVGRHMNSVIVNTMRWVGHTLAPLTNI